MWCFETAKLPFIPDNAARLCVVVVGVANTAGVEKPSSSSQAQNNSASSASFCDGDGDGRVEIPRRTASIMTSFDAERHADLISEWWYGYA